MPNNTISTFSMATTHIQNGKVSGIHSLMSFLLQVVLLNKLNSFLTSHQLANQDSPDIGKTPQRKCMLHI